MSKIENETENFDHKTKKGKFGKKSSADKNTADASTLNDLDDGDTKEDNATDRPKKKNGRKKIRNRQKKLQKTSDDFFCGAPSKY